MIYVGCTLKPVPNWQEILPAPTAPSNYKDPEKIAAYVTAKVQELHDGKAAISVLSGSIAEGVIMPSPKLEEDGINKIVVTNGIDLIGQLVLLLNKVPEKHKQVSGYKIHRNLRLAAIEYVTGQTGHPLPADTQWMLTPNPEMRYGVDWFDPVSVLFGSSDEDPDGVCRRLGIEADLSSAEGQALFAKAVTERFRRAS